MLNAIEGHFVSGYANGGTENRTLPLEKMENLKQVGAQRYRVFSAAPGHHGLLKRFSDGVSYLATNRVRDGAVLSIAMFTKRVFTSDCYSATAKSDETR